MVGRLVSHVGDCYFCLLYSVLYGNWDVNMKAVARINKLFKNINVKERAIVSLVQRVPPALLPPDMQTPHSPRLHQPEQRVREL